MICSRGRAAYALIADERAATVVESLTCRSRSGGMALWISSPDLCEVEKENQVLFEEKSKLTYLHSDLPIRRGVFGKAARMNC